MRVAVLGATGFVGRALVPALEELAEVVAVSRGGPVEADVANMPGTEADGAALVAAIDAAVPGAGALVSYEPVSLPFPVDLDTTGIERLLSIR